MRRAFAKTTTSVKTMAYLVGAAFGQTTAYVMRTEFVETTAFMMRTAFAKGGGIRDENANS